MGILAGPFVSAAALLALGGVFKARQPAATARALTGVGLPTAAPLARALGIVEVIVAVEALDVGNRLFAGLVAAFYVGFAAFVGLALRRPTPVSDCGCFGATESPPSVVHLVLDVAAAAVAIGVVVTGGQNLRAILADQPLAGVPFVAVCAVCTGLAYAALTVLPRALAEARP